MRKKVTHPQEQFSKSTAKLKKPLYKQWWFWLIIVVVIGAIGGAAGLGESAPANQPTTATTENVKESTEKSKETASDFDFAMWKQYTSRIDANYELIRDSVTSSSLFDMYSTYEGVQEQCRDINDGIDATDTDLDAEDEAEKYKESVSGYCSCVSVAANSLMNYINGGDMEDLSDAKESISAAQFAKDEIIAAREAFLKASGFSDDEIASLLSE